MGLNSEYSKGQGGDLYPRVRVGSGGGKYLVESGVRGNGGQN